MQDNNVWKKERKKERKKESVRDFEVEKVREVNIYTYIHICIDLHLFWGALMNKYVPHAQQTPSCATAKQKLVYIFANLS